jgi:hypothetical protein
MTGNRCYILARSKGLSVLRHADTICASHPASCVTCSGRHLSFERQAEIKIKITSRKVTQTAAIWCQV